MPLFLLVLLVMCFFYRPMVGLALGIGFYCLVWWIIYGLMGGE